MHRPEQVTLRAARRRGEGKPAPTLRDEALLEAERELARLNALPSVGGNVPPNISKGLSINKVVNWPGLERLCSSNRRERREARG